MNFFHEFFNRNQPQIQNQPQQPIEQNPQSSPPSQAAANNAGQAALQVVGASAGSPPLATNTAYSSLDNRQRTQLEADAVKLKLLQEGELSSNPSFGNMKFMDFFTVASNMLKDFSPPYLRGASLFETMLSKVPPDEQHSLEEAQVPVDPRNPNVVENKGRGTGIAYRIAMDIVKRGLAAGKSKAKIIEELKAFGNRDVLYQNTSTNSNKDASKLMIEALKEAFQPTITPAAGGAAASGANHVGAVAAKVLAPEDFAFPPPPLPIAHAQAHPSAPAGALVPAPAGGGAASSGLVNAGNLARHIKTLTTGILESRSLMINQGWTVGSRSIPLEMGHSPIRGNSLILTSPQGIEYLLGFTTHHGRDDELVLFSDMRPISPDEIYGALIDSGLLTREDAVRAGIIAGQAASDALVVGQPRQAVALGAQNAVIAEQLPPHNQSQWRSTFAALAAQQKMRKQNDPVNSITLIQLPPEGVTRDEMGGAIAMTSLISGFDRFDRSLFGSTSVNASDRLVLPPNSVARIGNILLTGPITDKKAYYKNLICSLVYKQVTFDIPQEDSDTFSRAIEELKGEFEQHKPSIPTQEPLSTTYFHLQFRFPDGNTRQLADLMRTNSSGGSGKNPFYSGAEITVRPFPRGSQLNGPHALTTCLSGSGPLQTAESPTHLQMLSAQDRATRLQFLHNELDQRLGNNRRFFIDSFTGFDGSPLTVERDTSNNIVIKALTNRVTLKPDGTFEFSGHFNLEGVPDNQGTWFQEKITEPYTRAINSSHATPQSVGQSIRDNYSTSLLALVEEHDRLGTLNLVPPGALVNTTTRAESTANRMVNIVDRLKSISENQPEGRIVLLNPTLIPQDSEISVSWRPLSQEELRQLGLSQGFKYTFSKQTFSSRGGARGGDGVSVRETDVLAGVSPRGEPVIKVFMDKTDRRSSRFSGSSETSNVSIFEKRGSGPLQYSKTNRHYTDPEFLFHPMTETFTTASPADAIKDLQYFEQILATNQALLNSNSTIEPGGRNLRGELVPDSQLLASRLVLQGPIQMMTYLEGQIRSLNNTTLDPRALNTPLRLNQSDSTPLPLQRSDLRRILLDTGLQPPLLIRDAADIQREAAAALGRANAAFRGQFGPEFDLTTTPELVSIQTTGGPGEIRPLGLHQRDWAENPLLQRFEAAYAERLAHLRRDGFSSTAQAMLQLRGGQSYRDALAIFHALYMECKRNDIVFNVNTLETRLDSYVNRPENRYSRGAVDIAKDVARQVLG